MKKNDIICFAGNLYDQKPWTNRQQIMTKLSEIGYRVIYIEPPKNIIYQFIKLILNIKQEQKVIKWFKRLIRLEKRKKNLYLFSLIKILPIKYRNFRKINYLFYCYFLKRKFSQIQIKNPILWIYTPDAVVFAGKFGELLLCYDCVDKYDEQPYYKKNFKEIEKDEIELLKKADLVFTSSKNLYEDKKKYNNNTYLVHNVGDYNHFIKTTYIETKIPEDIIRISSPRIGFVGSIDDYKLDIELLLYLSKQRPNWSIIMIGPEGVADKKISTYILRQYENIYFLGKRDYELLPNYLKGLDVLIIPYKNNEYTRNCFPIKIFEYLASGKPVVVSGLPELERYKDIIGFAYDYEMFVRLVESFLKNDTQYQKEKRMKLAKENTWEKKVEKEIEIIEEFIKHKINNENRN